jgi:hypothetical protein
LGPALVLVQALQWRVVPATPNLYALVALVVPLAVVMVQALRAA